MMKIFNVNGSQLITINHLPEIRVVTSNQRLLELDPIEWM